MRIHKDLCYKYLHHRRDENKESGKSSTSRMRLQTNLLSLMFFQESPLELNKNKQNRCRRSAAQRLMSEHFFFFFFFRIHVHASITFLDKIYICEDY